MGKSYTELKKGIRARVGQKPQALHRGRHEPGVHRRHARVSMRQVFRKERTFRDNTPARIEYWDDPRLDNPVEYFSRPKKDLDTQLEDTSSRACPKGRPRATRRSSCWSVAGYTQSEIAVKLHISQVCSL